MEKSTPAYHGEQCRAVVLFTPNAVEIELSTTFASRASVRLCRHVESSCSATREGQDVMD